jgi:hypothetical protein
LTKTIAEISSGVYVVSYCTVTAINRAYKVLGVTPVLDLYQWLSTLVGELEWPVLPVHLDVLVIVCSSHETLGVKDSVGRVLSGLVLGRITD